MKTICKNCGAQIQGNYCSNCGQRTTIDKVSFKETFQDVAKTFFSVDAPFFLTLKEIFFNPGKLFREFLDGKRKTYYKPVSFFVLTTIIYLLVRSLIDYNPMTTEGIKVEGELLVEGGKYMVKNINNVMFLFVFSLGLFLKVFFFKRYSLAEYTAIAFYLISVYAILGMVAMFYLKFKPPNYKMIPMILFLLYLIYALVSFFQKNKFIVGIKTVFVFLFSFSVYTLLGFFMSLLIVWIKS